MTRCADGSFGLPFGNRKCTTFCPEGWWGEPDLNICVNTTARTFIFMKNARQQRLTLLDILDMRIIILENVYILINALWVSMQITQLKVE